jgi:hypothetical protein
VRVGACCGLLLRVVSLAAALPRVHIGQRCGSVNSGQLLQQQWQCCRLPPPPLDGQSCPRWHPTSPVCAAAAVAAAPAASC